MQEDHHLFFFFFFLNTRFSVLICTSDMHSSKDNHVLGAYNVLHFISKTHFQLIGRWEIDTPSNLIKKKKQATMFFCFFFNPHCLIRDTLDILIMPRGKELGC